MSGIFTYIYHKFKPHVAKWSLHSEHLGIASVQEISNTTHWTDPEKTWVSHSSIATYWTGSIGKVPFNFWWIVGVHLSNERIPGCLGFIGDYTTQICS